MQMEIGLAIWSPSAPSEETQDHDKRRRKGENTAESLAQVTFSRTKV